MYSSCPAKQELTRKRITTPLAAAYVRLNAPHKSVNVPASGESRVPVGRVFNATILLALLLIFRASPSALHLSPDQPSETQATRENYVGDATCGSCHAAIDQTYLRTGH